MNKKKCKQCGKRDDKPMRKVALSYVHEKCIEAYIKDAVKIARIKKRATKKKKKEALTKLKEKIKHNRTWHRKRAIRLASKLALERDQYQCVHCGKKATDGQIQASHVHSKGTHLFLCADVENIKALCSHCHLRWWHSNPVEAGIWFKEKYPDRYNYLRLRILNHHKGSKPDWETEYNKLKNS